MRTYSDKDREAIFVGRSDNFRVNIMRHAHGDEYHKIEFGWFRNLDDARKFAFSRGCEAECLMGDRWYADEAWAGILGSVVALITYRFLPQERKKWRCFHCDAVFTDPERAREHFGSTERKEPLCRYTREFVDDLERQLASYREEDTELHRQVANLRVEMTAAVQAAEEKGYARGLREGDKHAWLRIEGYEAAGKCIELQLDSAQKLKPARPVDRNSRAYRAGRFEAFALAHSLMAYGEFPELNKEMITAWKKK